MKPEKKYKTQGSLKLIGQANFDNQKSPCPGITHPVKFGEEFEILENIDIKKLTKLQVWKELLKKK